VKSEDSGEVSEVPLDRFGPSPLQPIPVCNAVVRVANNSNENKTATLPSATMSRQSMAPQRNLSLTEELEKLEQSITLTLQGKQTLLYPTNATDRSRNRPQFQSRASHRNYWHSAHCRTIWKAFGGCMGGIQVLEAVLRSQCKRVAVRLRSARPGRIDCPRGHAAVATIRR
jgi:hypothetical protein